MRALIAVEIRRMLARRLVRLFLALALLNVVVSGIWIFAKSNRDVAGARAARHAAGIEACVRGEFGPPPALFEPGEREEFCASITDGNLEDVDPRFHLTDLTDVFQALSPLLIIGTWLLGASFVGAEWEAGTIATFLTWEPRRLRVLVGKALAAIVVGIAATALLQALLAGALLPAAVFRGTTEGTDAAWLRATVGVALRVTALAGVAATIGLSIAAITRRTSAALGAALLILIVELILHGLLPEWRRWFAGVNAAVFVSGEDGGVPPINRSPLGAGLLLSIYATGIFGAAAAHFRRRDVT